MRFYWGEECEAWLTERKRTKPEAVQGTARYRLAYPHEPHRVFYNAHWIATQLTYRMQVLLWITKGGIWPSTENWHLYYRLRQSYHDYRLLHEAPGHLFLEYEAEGLASFLQLSMLNGWDGYVLTQADYANVFFSHDEYLDFYGGAIDEVRKALGEEMAAVKYPADPRV